jgi:outer membrane protein OmpA-like peptidoglycan-associated protein
MKKFILFIILFVVIYAPVQAQRLLGVSTGNYNTISSLYLNPANIADSRNHFTVELFSLNAGFDNSLGTISTSELLNNFGKNGNINFNKLFSYTNNNNVSLLAPYLEVRGPSFTYAFNSKHSIALTTRMRGVNQFDNFDRKLFRSIVDNSFANTSGNFSVQADHFNWTEHVWGELGLSYAAVILNTGVHQIKGGFTVRLLTGLQYYTLTSSGINANFDAASSTLTVTKTNLKFATNTIDSKGNSTISISPSDLLSKFMGGGNSGLGADLGVVYEYRPNYYDYAYEMDGNNGYVDRNKNTYKLRFSAAITDIGAIAYSKKGYAVSFGGNGTISPNTLYDNVKNPVDLKTVLQSKGFLVDTGVAHSVIHMPTSLLMGVDYNIGANFYANGLWMTNIYDRSKEGTSIYSQFTLTPRYDIRHFSIGMPVTYSNLTESLRWGLGLRLGGFYIGSDDMLALFGSGRQYGANFYVGLKVSGGWRRIKDSDGDGVSDKKDLCPRDKGTWSNHGCPADIMAQTGTGLTDRDLPTNSVKDTDGDGVPDTEDRCPTVAGDYENHGCPTIDRSVRRKVEAAATAIEFETGEANIKASSYGEIDQVITILEDYPGYTMVIEGHTDNVGNPESNMTLSRERAEAVRSYLILRGISAERLVAKGFGDTKPVASNNTEQGRARNRRVVMELKMKD